MIQLIFAHCDGIFGYKDELPWNHVPGDLSHFKKQTEGTVLLMGPNTFKSLPRKLPGRPNVVVVSNPNRDNTGITNKSGGVPDQIMTQKFLSLEVSDNVYSVIGGTRLLEEAFDYADIIIVTEISKHHLKEEVIANPNSPDIVRLSDEFLRDIRNMEMTNRIMQHYERTTDYNMEVWV